MADSKTIISEAEEKMDMAVMYLDESLAHIRAGKADVRLLDGIRVDSYGSMVPINNVAAVTTPDARSIAIKPWDSPSERRNESSVSHHNYVLPFLVRVEVALVLRTVPGKLVVHTIRNSSGQHSLVIAECLTHPDDKNIVLGDFLSVGRVNARVEIVNYGFNRNLHELLVFHTISPQNLNLGSFPLQNFAFAVFSASCIAPNIASTCCSVYS